MTALYTSAVWAWGGLPGADLLVTRDSRAVFRVVNFVLAIVAFFRRGLPSLRHSLLHRHAIIDCLAERSAAARILELAAGLSPRGVALSASPERELVEVDLDEMVTLKKEVLAETEAGRAALARPNLRIESGDATGDLRPWLTPGERTLVVVEGLLVYMDAAARRALWREVATRLEGSGGELVFDLIPGAEEPRPGLLGRALGWLMRRFTGGRGFVRDETTRADIVADLRDAGFAEVEIFEPAAPPIGLELPHPDAASQTVVFRARVAAAGAWAFESPPAGASRPAD